MRFKFCRLAKPALEERRYEDSFNNLTRAKSVVMELGNGLNHKAAPELCQRLSAMYTYLYRRLVDANTRRDPAIMDEVIELLEYERETWQMLMERHAQEAGRPATPEQAVEHMQSPMPAEMPRFSQERVKRSPA